MEVVLHTITPADTEIIRQLAEWHYQEWKMPHQRTIDRLTALHSNDILFHFVLLHGGMPVASGGLHVQVGLFREHERYQTVGPWVAILYTLKNYRNMGLGKKLLLHIEEKAEEMGYKKIYLYTSTAQHLYEKQGWKVIDELIYKETPNVVMEKTL